MENKEMLRFIEACTAVMESFGMEVRAGEVQARRSPFHADTIVIVIGLTGDLHGQAIMSMEQSTACHIASAMMGGVAMELNEVTKSAVAELTNMIIGNSATLLSQCNVMLDITPPSVLTGENIHISTVSACSTVPFLLNGERIMEFSLSAKELDTL